MCINEENEDSLDLLNRTAAIVFGVSSLSLAAFGLDAGRML